MLLVELHDEYNDLQRSAPLRAWRAAGRKPRHPVGAVGVREDATTPSLETVRAVLEHHDMYLADRFRRRFGISDLDAVARNDVDAPPVWIRTAALMSKALDRAMLAVVAVTGIRAEAIRRLTVGDFQPLYLLPVPIAGFAPARVGALRMCGLKGHPDRVKALPEQATVRVEAWLWIYRRMLSGNGIELRRDHPLFPSSVYKQHGSGVKPQPYARRSLWLRFAGQSVPGRRPSIALVPLNKLAAGKSARDLEREGVDPRPEHIWRGAGPHGLGRFADQTVYEFADRFQAQHAELRRVSAVALKEALLDHKRIPDDPLGYTGLSREDARRHLACIAAHVIADAIWGDLALRRGPDERHLREAYHAIRGVRQHLAEAEHDLRTFDDGIFELPPHASVSALKIQRRVSLDRRVADLRHDVARWEAHARELEHEHNWIYLPDNQPRVDAIDLRRAILTEPTQPPLVRDWLTQRELRKLLGSQARPCAAGRTRRHRTTVAPGHRAHHQ